MNTTIIIIILVIVCCASLSISIGGGIFVVSQTTTTPKTTIVTPTLTSSTPVPIIKEESQEIITSTTPAPTTGTPAPTTGTPAPTSTTPAPYNIWQCYLNSNKTRRDTYNDDGKNGFMRDQAFTQENANDFCNAYVSDCGNMGGCTAHNYIAEKEPTNAWQCYLNSDKTRRDTYNDSGKNGFVREQAFTQANANEFCNAYVSDCANMGGCTAYKTI
jgi:hypothetical protein